MTKEKLEEIKNDLIYCNECNNYRETSCFSIRNIRTNKTGVCKTCDWIKHNFNKIDKKLSKTQYYQIIDSIIFEKNLVVNNLAQLMGINLTDMINIITSLRIGNKHYEVEVVCEKCKKHYNIPPSVFLKNKNYYCSRECYWSDKTNKVLKGVDSPYYTKIKVLCSNCNKEIYRTPYNINKKNSFDDNHNFCSHKCYSDFRSKYYVGDRHSKINYTPELLEKLRINRAKSLSGIERLNTTIQLKVNSFLNELNEKYIREYAFKYYNVDNYLPEHNLIIEVMGDYWHTNPNKYNKFSRSINQKQYEGIYRDKSKHTYILKEYGIEILYLWEYDINNHPDMCKQLIKEYIKHKGILENYHSFNYSLNNNKLILDKNIIPYQDLPNNEYKILLR